MGRSGPTFWTVSAATVALAMLAPAAAAQTSDRRGQVVDLATERGLGDALVTIVATGATVRTDAEGQFEFTSLRPGAYAIRVERGGYETSEGRMQVPGPGELLVLMTPAEVDPSLPGRIEGRVTDEDSDWLRNVEVSAVGESFARALTNDQGRFSIQAIPAGTHEIRFSSIGYESRSVTLVVHPGQTTDVSARLASEVTVLDPILVTVRSSYLERSGFYRREREGRGRFFTQADIEDFQPDALSDLLGRRLGIWMLAEDGVATAYYRTQVGARPRDLNQNGFGAAVSRGCSFGIWVDGVPQFGPAAVDMIPVERIQAVEVYRGRTNTPLWFGGGCGVVVIWTKR